MEKANNNKRRRNGSRKGCFWLLGIAVVLIVGVVAWKMTHKKPDDTKTAVAKRQDIRQSVTATGSVTLQTSAEVKIGAEVSGKVKHLFVDVGDTVHTGQLVAELQNAESDAMMLQSKASVDSAMARVRQSEAALAQQRPSTAAAIARARAEVRAAEARYQQTALTSGSQPAVTQADIDRATAELSIAQDALTQTRSTIDLQVQTAQAALDASQAQADQAAANAKRSRDLVAKGYISKSDAENAETTVRVNEADVVAKKKALALAQANAKHDLSSAIQRVKQAQAGLKTSRSNASEVGIRSAQADAARQDLTSAREALQAAIAGEGDIAVRIAQAEEAKASYRQTAAEYERQRNNYAKMRIFSPIDGIVTTVEAKVGETVTAGFQTPTLLTIADLSRTQVDVPVDETDIGTLKVGQKAKVNVDAFPNHPLAGRVVKVASDTIANATVVSYNITVAIDKADVPLKPKMTAKVEVDTGLVRNALVVPLDAVKTSKDNDVVYVPKTPGKDSDQGAVKGAPAPPGPKLPSRFREVVVKTGASDDKVIQIVSGVKEGQTVVLTSSDLDKQRQLEQML
ncbi:MAG TPA: efflux RND transporter periplasmic adaptor subunit [Armatimonadota bacterium]